MNDPVIIGNATLYLGDCREILREVTADILMTDPVWPNAPTGMFPLVTDPALLLSQAFTEISWIQRAVIVLRSDSDPRFLRAVPERLPFFLAQILQYVMPGYIGRKLGGNEIAYVFGKPLPSAPGRRVIPGMSPWMRQASDTRRTRQRNCACDGL